jgi:uncharacterized protein DUF2695
MTTELAMDVDETAEIKRDLEERKRRNEERKQQDLVTEAAVRKLKVDWSLFQSEVKDFWIEAAVRKVKVDDDVSEAPMCERINDALAKGCKHDLRACRRILWEMGLPRSEVALVLRFLPLQGGHCDCEVFRNVDMTNPRPLGFFDCLDCGADFDERYMVKDAVWAAGGLEPDGGKLCIGCLERRLGRQLNRDDFQPFKSSSSLRLLDRSFGRRGR